MDIVIKDVNEYAVQYIVDLIERDQNANIANSVRGSSLFQDVNFIKNLIRQEIVLSHRKIEAV